MGNVIWVSTDGNWNNTASWDTAAVPVDNDDVFLSNSAEDADTNLDQNTIFLDSLNISNTFMGKVGGSGNPLIIDSDVLLYEGAGTEAHFQGEYTKAIIAGSGSAGAITINAQGAVTGIVDLYHNKGALTLAASSNVTNIFVGYDSVRTTDATLTIGTSCTLTTLTCMGGVTTLESAITTINQTGGTLTVNGTGTITTANVYGGTLYWNSTGTLTTANVYGGGTFDASNEVKPRTITTLNAYAGSTIELGKVNGGLIITNAVPNYGAGRIAVPAGAEITLA